MGCKENCSFCNQKRITGKISSNPLDDLNTSVKTAYEYSKDLGSTEIAFFGGSFTAIDRELMEVLLKRAQELKEKYSLMGIRISTRPDCIDEEILEILKMYGVTSIELGAQSMDDEVLHLNKRGHTAEDIVKSFNLIKSYGFESGLQIMTGLYGSDTNKDYETALKAVKLKPDTLRIYPTVVFRDTMLCDLFNNGVYKPQTLEQAVDLCAKIVRLCDDENINIIRLGLHSTDELKNSVAGPSHPAFAQLCRSRIFFEDLVAKLTKKGSYIVCVNERQLSFAIGQNKENIIKLDKLGFKVKFKASKELKSKEIIIEEEKSYAS